MPNPRSPRTRRATIGLLVTVLSTFCVSQQPRATMNGDTAGAEAGRSLATGFDLDGDGRNDFLVGARGNGTTPYAGKVYVYSGTGAPLHTFSGEAVGDEYGVGCALIGDVTGDGRPDILIGARGVDQPGSSNGGRVYLYHGVTPGHVQDYGLVATIDGPAGSEFGTSLAAMNDVDGDGFPDFAVGAPSVLGGLAGRVYVYSGATRAFIVSIGMNEVGDAFGYALSQAGDVDGDALCDLAVGALTADSPASVDTGRVYVFHTATTGHAFDWGVIHVFNGEGTGDRFGTSLDGVGDLNGDGHGEVLVGASRYDLATMGPDDNRGRAYLFDGASGGLLTTWTGEADRDWLGIGVANAGDIDNDGRPELVLGACQTEKGGHGRAYLVETATYSIITVTSGEFGLGIPHQGDAFGYAVAGMGDIDGDGGAEYLVSAYGVDGLGGTNSGRVTLFSSAVRYFGRNSGGVNVLDLDTVGWAKLGTPFTLVTRNCLPNALGLVGFSAQKASFPIFGGTFLLDPGFLTLFVQQADPTGTMYTTFDVPTNVAYLGEWGHFQTAAFDPTQPFGLAFSYGMTFVAVQ